MIHVVKCWQHTMRISFVSLFVVLWPRVTIADGPSSVAIPNEDAVVNALVSYLEHGSEIQKDFAAWVSVEQTTTGDDFELPLVLKVQYIFAANEVDSWQYWSQGQKSSRGPENNPFWAQYLRNPDHITTLRVGVGPIVRKGEIKEKAKQNLHFRNPFHRALSDVTAIQMNRTSEQYLTRLFLEVAKLGEASYEKKTGDLLARFELGGNGFDVWIDVRFSSDKGMMPSEVVFNSMEDGKVMISNYTRTKWQQKAKHWLPTSFESFTQDCAGTVKQDLIVDVEWKVGDEAPNQLPAYEDDDWRRYFCELFERDCYDHKARMAELSALRGLFKKSKQTEPSDPE